jgi:serine/threonine protein kinase
LRTLYRGVCHIQDAKLLHLLVILIDLSLSLSLFVCVCVCGWIDIFWPDIPEEMSPEAQDLIDRLLTTEPSERLGANGADEIKSHPFFKNVNWDTVLLQAALFVPNITSDTDASYFNDGMCCRTSECARERERERERESESERERYH